MRSFIASILCAAIAMPTPAIALRSAGPQENPALRQEISSLLRSASGLEENQPPSRQPRPTYKKLTPTEQAAFYAMSFAFGAFYGFVVGIAAQHPDMGMTIGGSVGVLVTPLTSRFARQGLILKQVQRVNKARNAVVEFQPQPGDDKFSQAVRRRAEWLLDNHTVSVEELAQFIDHLVENRLSLEGHSVDPKMRRLSKEHRLALLLGQTLLDRFSITLPLLSATGLEEQQQFIRRVATTNRRWLEARLREWHANHPVDTQWFKNLFGAGLGTARNLSGFVYPGRRLHFHFTPPIGIGMDTGAVLRMDEQGNIVSIAMDSMREGGGMDSDEDFLLGTSQVVFEAAELETLVPGFIAALESTLAKTLDGNWKNQVLETPPGKFFTAETVFPEGERIQRTLRADQLYEKEEEYFQAMRTTSRENFLGSALILARDDGGIPILFFDQGYLLKRSDAVVVEDQLEEAARSASGLSAGLEQTRLSDLTGAFYYPAAGVDALPLETVFQQMPNIGNIVYLDSAYNMRAEDVDSISYGEMLIRRLQNTYQYVFQVKKIDNSFKDNRFEITHLKTGASKTLHLVSEDVLTTDIRLIPGIKKVSYVYVNKPGENSNLGHQPRFWTRILGQLEVGGVVEIHTSSDPLGPHSEESESLIGLRKVSPGSGARRYVKVREVDPTQLEAICTIDALSYPGHALYFMKVISLDEARQILNDQLVPRLWAAISESDDLRRIFEIQTQGQLGERIVGSLWGTEDESGPLQLIPGLQEQLRIQNQDDLRQRLGLAPTGLEEISIERADAADEMEILSLFGQFSEEINDGSQRPELETANDLERARISKIVRGQEFGLILMARMGDALVGYLLVSDHFLDDQDGYYSSIDHIFVLPEYRENGIATRLVKTAINTYPQQGGPEWFEGVDGSRSGASGNIFTALGFQLLKEDIYLWTIRPSSEFFSYWQGEDAGWVIIGQSAIDRVPLLDGVIDELSRTTLWDRIIDLSRLSAEEESLRAVVDDIVSAGGHVSIFADLSEDASSQALVQLLREGGVVVQDYSPRNLRAIVQQILRVLAIPEKLITDAWVDQFITSAGLEQAA